MKAAIKKRLISFINSGKEIILAINPFILTIVNIVIISVMLSSIKTIDIQMVSGMLFPFLLVLSFLLSNGLYILQSTQDRFDKTRYLLNFAG